MTALSVNVNKFALVRNARGADLPNLIDISNKCLNFGADGITVHPRPDERHAKFSDIEPLKNLLAKFENKEFNIEGYPSDFFVKKVIEVKPDQVTLVPDPPGALTSSFGWDCHENKEFLRDIVSEFKKNKIRVSIFINPSIKTLENLKVIQTDRVELYTYDYAHNFIENKDTSIKSYIDVSTYLKKESTKPLIGRNIGCVVVLGTPHCVDGLQHYATRRRRTNCIECTYSGLLAHHPRSSIYI